MALFLYNLTPKKYRFLVLFGYFMLELKYEGN